MSLVVKKEDVYHSQTFKTGQCPLLFLLGLLGTEIGRNLIRLRALKEITS